MDIVAHTQIEGVTPTTLHVHAYGVLERESTYVPG
jgi:hypothetical protein